MSNAKTAKQKFQSRKLIGAACLFVASTVFLALEQTNFDAWASFNKWLFGMYVVGNLGEHTKSAVEKGITNKIQKAG